MYMYVHSCRISYVVYALEMIKNRSNQLSQVFLLYDVACLLKRHLQVNIHVIIILLHALLNTSLEHLYCVGKGED